MHFVLLIIDSQREEEEEGRGQRDITDLHQKETRVICTPLLIYAPLKASTTEDLNRWRTCSTKVIILTRQQGFA